MATITIDVPDEVAKELTEKYSKKKEFPDWEELGEISGYFVNSNSDVNCIKKAETREQDKYIRTTKELAEASIAMAQLSQLLKHCNGDWIPDWSDGTEKYVISFYIDEIVKSYVFTVKSFLVFQTEEKRDGFLKAYRPLIMIAKPLL